MPQRVGSKKPETPVAPSTPVVNVTPEPINPPASENPMPENTVIDSPAPDTDTPNDTGVVHGPETKRDATALDMFENNCPATELLARYTDDERANLRRLRDLGDFLQITRDVVVKADKNPTGVDQAQSFVGYVPIIRIIETTADGRIIADITPAVALANGKVAFHTDWKALGQIAKTDAQTAAKNADELWGMTSYFDHGFDLKIRGNVRDHFTDELMGPIGEIAKQVRILFVNEFEPTKQAAFDAVVESWGRKGKAIPEGLTLERLGIKWPAGK